MAGEYIKEVLKKVNVVKQDCSNLKKGGMVYRKEKDWEEKRIIIMKLLSPVYKYKINNKWNKIKIKLFLKIVKA